MKNTKQCPKCGSKYIICPDYTSASTSSAFDTIPLTWTGKAIYIKKYICSDCGYVEYWIDNKEDLEDLKEKYSNI